MTYLFSLQSHEINPLVVTISPVKKLKPNEFQEPAQTFTVSKWSQNVSPGSMFILFVRTYVCDVITRKVTVVLGNVNKSIVTRT